MDIKAIIELIANFGFPIACVIAMGIFIYHIYKDSKAREDKLMKEICSTRAVNEKAIDTIAHYAEKLDTIQQDIKDIKTEITVIAAKQD